MPAIKGEYRNGQIILSENADWPEDTDVLVEPVPQEKTLGIRDEDWSTDPKGIANLLTLIEGIEPFEMTTEEEAQWQAARKERKDYEITHFEETARRNERLFE